MTDRRFEDLRGAALDAGVPIESRLGAIRGLVEFRNRSASEALIELGGRQDETERILRAAGAALGELLVEGLVSEWDIRDLAPPAADAFHA